MGRLSFTEYAHLLLTGREPTEDERFFFDVLLVSIAEHGLMPSNVAARMTLAADPASLHDQRSPSRRSITLERRRDGKPLAVQAQAERSAGRLHTPGRRSRREASRARSSSSPSRASSLDTAGRWRRWSSAALNGSARRAHRRNDARSDPREHCERPSAATLDARQRHRSSFRTSGHAAPTRAYESRHRRRRQPMRSPRRTRPADRGRLTPARLTDRTPYECPGMASER